MKDESAGIPTIGEWEKQRDKARKEKMEQARSLLFSSIETALRENPLNSCPQVFNNELIAGQLSRSLIEEVNESLAEKGWCLQYCAHPFLSNSIFEWRIVPLKSKPAPPKLHRNWWRRFVDKMWCWIYLMSGEC